MGCEEDRMLSAQEIAEEQTLKLRMQVGFRLLNRQNGAHDFVGLLLHFHVLEKQGKKEDVGSAEAGVAEWFGGLSLEKNAEGFNQLLRVTRRKVEVSFHAVDSPGQFANTDVYSFDK